MSTEGNKEIVRRYNDEAYNRGNVDIIDELVAPECRLGGASRQEYKISIAQTHAAMPDLHLQIGEMLAEGDLVAMKWTVTATAGHGDPSPQVWPASTPFTFSGITIYTVRDGKIIKDDFVNNYTEMLVLAGGNPMPSPKSA